MSKEQIHIYQNKRQISDSKGLIFACLLILVFFFSNKIYAQREKLSDAFIRNFEMVRKLESYSNAAWFVSKSIVKEPDSIISQLSSDWFCYPAEEMCWYAVYGKWENDKYIPLLNYEVDTNWVIKRNFAKDTITVDQLSQALRVAKNHYATLVEVPPIDLNWFVIQDKKNINVIVLPAIQSDGSMVYGYEYHIIISQKDMTVKDTMQYYSELLYYKPDKEKDIELKYNECTTPSVGAIYFAWYYRRYFKSVSISCKKFSWGVFNWMNGKYSWWVIKKDKDSRQ